MEPEDIPPRLLRLARRFNVYLILGLLIVISALALGAWEASALQTMDRLEGQGMTDSTEYVQAQRVATVIRVVNPTWNFVGLGLLTFGIGMSIVVIIHHLTGAGREALAAYWETFPDAPIPLPPKPRYASLFPKLLFLGLVLLVLNFLFALSGGLAQAGLLVLSFGGFTSASWGAFAEVLRTPQRPGFMAFVILGIAFSLATIVYNLRLQARLLPRVLGALRSGQPAEIKGTVRPRLPRLPFALVVGGVVLVLLASYPVGFLGALGRADLVASGSVAGARQIAWASAVFPVLAVTGIVTLLAGIVYWLLLIIQGLRDQRALIQRIGLSLAGVEPKPLEQPLWPEKVAPYLAGAGVVTLLMLFVPASLLIYLRWELLRIGPGTGAAFVNLVFLRDLLTVLIPDLRFLGFALVMLGIGLTLGVILINLRGIGMILPGTMTKLLQAKGKVSPPPVDPDEGDVEARAVNAMQRWPHRLFLPLLVGALIMISTTFPLVVPLHLTPQLQWRDATLAGDDALAADLALQMDVLAALREPWNFIGMGLIFFAIGRFFGTIIGFVNARRVVISDTCGSLAVPPATAQESE